MARTTLYTTKPFSRVSGEHGAYVEALWGRVQGLREAGHLTLVNIFLPWGWTLQWTHRTHGPAFSEREGYEPYYACLPRWRVRMIRRPRG
jgi:hypothetical protein